MWSLLLKVFVLFSLVTVMGSLFQSFGELFVMSCLSSFLLNDLRLLFSFSLIESLIYLGISVFSAVCIIVRILYMDLCLKLRNLSFFLYNVSEWVGGCVSECVSEWVSKLMSELVSKWVSEWVN